MYKDCDHAFIKPLLPDDLDIVAINTLLLISVDQLYKNCLVIYTNVFWNHKSVSVLN